MVADVDVTSEGWTARDEYVGGDGSRIYLTSPEGKEYQVIDPSVPLNAVRERDEWSRYYTLNWMSHVKATGKIVGFSLDRDATGETRALWGPDNEIIPFPYQ